MERLSIYGGLYDVVASNICFMSRINYQPEQNYIIRQHMIAIWVERHTYVFKTLIQTIQLHAIVL